MNRGIAVLGLRIAPAGWRVHSVRAMAGAGPSVRYPLIVFILILIFIIEKTPPSARLPDPLQNGELPP